MRKVVVAVVINGQQRLVKVGSLTRFANASCGTGTGCHGGSYSPFTIVKVDVGSRVLALGESTAVTVSGSNTGISGGRGGFTADVTAGSLIAGTTTRVNTLSDAITHASALGRSWKFNFKAPSTAGLAEFYTAVNIVDGNGRSSGKDEWAFHSGKIVATQSTPVRLYANAPFNASFGESCPDGYGNYAVLGSPTKPQIGRAYTVAAHGLPPAALSLLMLSVNGTPPNFDMTVMGAPGCRLLTDATLEAFLVTSKGDASRAEGSVVLPSKLPNNSALVGTVFHLQLMVKDAKSTRALQVVTTNRLSFTVQS